MGFWNLTTLKYLLNINTLVKHQPLKWKKNNEIWKFIDSVGNNVNSFKEIKIVVNKDGHCTCFILKIKTSRFCNKLFNV